MPMDHMVPYLVFDRYIGSGKWSKVSLWLHSNDSSLCGPFGPWPKWPTWSWLISSFGPISAHWTGSNVDAGGPLRGFLVHHVIVVLGW